MFLKRNVFKTRMKVFQIILVIILPILMIPATVLLTKCNISYEDVPESRINGLHSTRPPFSNIYHGSYYRFPEGSCDEPQCHYSDLKGGNTGGPSCYSCHNDLWSVFSVSHTLKVGGRYHHNAVDNGNFEATCGINGCHGSNGTTLFAENQTGYDFRYSCYACHDPIPTPGHRVSKEGVLHHKDIGKDPHVYCYKAGCHGDGEPGGKCGRCHGSDYPTGD